MGCFFPAGEVNPAVVLGLVLGNVVNPGLQCGASVDEIAKLVNITSITIWFMRPYGTYTLW